MKNKILEFAKTRGYDGAEYDGKWKGFEVYEPTFDADEPVTVGLPLVILVSDNEIRMSTETEAFEYLDTLDEYSDAE